MKTLGTLLLLAFFLGVMAVSAGADESSGSVHTKCCAFGSARREVPCDVVAPPCTAFGCYVGDGLASHHVDTNGCAIDAMWLHRRDNDLSALGLLRTADNTPNQSIQPEPTGQFFADGILSFDATGFTVGSDFEVNQVDVTYCYYGFKRQIPFFDYGKYVGDNTDGRQFTMDFSPDVFMVVGIGFPDTGLRFRTSDNVGDVTLRLDATFLGDVLTDEIQAFKSIAGGDAYDGVELGQGANANGRTYFWLAWKVMDPARWVFVGNFAGTGADLDGSQHIEATPCMNATKMVMSSADPPGIPASIRFLARYFRHDAVKPAAYNYAQRFNATDVDDEPIGGADGGWRELNLSNFIFGNASGVPNHMANVTGYTYYYWGVCE